MKRLAAIIPFAVLALLIGQAGRVRADPDADPELTLRSGRQERTFTRSELLKRSDIETIVVAKDPAYAGRSMTYRAVRATTLFDGLTIAGDAVIQFRCLD